ncbi:hypothetical protein [uncultured Roseibium sp.]|uniref:hypothetical protein n=1 Tax=uncultured Roseibium sp. TaxID=1936171 RepID=UPI0032166A9D
MTIKGTNGVRFQSTRQTAETKAETTIRISKEIVQTEADIRNAKTEKLKAARLEMLARETGAATAGRKTANHKKASGSKD